MPCLSCGREFHEECINLIEDQCCCDSNTVFEPLKEIIDPKSTGRKRAAKLFPLEPHKNCEWLGLKYAGGGQYPIVGCINGKQKNRHHGPNKDTLANEPTNVHRICAVCHNRWHTLNDPGYNWNNPNLTPHDSETKATDQEIIENEKYWLHKKTKEAGGGVQVND